MASKVRYLFLAQYPSLSQPVCLPPLTPRMIPLCPCCTRLEWTRAQGVGVPEDPARHWSVGTTWRSTKIDVVGRTYQAQERRLAVPVAGCRIGRAAGRGGDSQFGPMERRLRCVPLLSVLVVCVTNPTAVQQLDMSFKCAVRWARPVHARPRRIRPAQRCGRCVVSGIRRRCANTYLCDHFNMPPTSCRMRTTTDDVSEESRKDRREDIP